MKLFATSGSGVLVLSLFSGLLLDTMPLPLWLDRFWPNWTCLILIYWCLYLPQRVGIGTGWLLGLVLDASKGALIGQYALGLSVAAFLTLKTHRRMRLFPVWQQSFSVCFFVFIDILLVTWINGMIGYPPRDAWFLLPVLSSMLCWPFVFMVLHDLGRSYNKVNV